MDSQESNDSLCLDGQLSYVGHDATSIPEHLAQTHQVLVKRLDLSFNCLRSLSGLENFPNLEEIILDNNELSNEGLTLPDLPNVHTLSLNKNHVDNLDQLLDEVQTHMPNLRFISLLGNKACPNELSASDKDEEDYQRYRVYVLHRLPKLKFLDSTPVRDIERKEAKEKGKYLKIVRPKEDSSKSNESASPSPYSPLPSTLRDSNSIASSFGRCRYVYYGRHSEGNRFIRNNDL